MSDTTTRSRSRWLPALGIVATVTVGALFLQSSVRAHETASEDFSVEEVEMFVQLLEIVQQYGEIASDASLSGVAAVMSIDDHLDGGEEAIGFLQGTMSEVSDPAVRRAIHNKLAELYSDAGQEEQALKHIRILITGPDR